MANTRTTPRKHRFSRAGKRLREIERLIRHRHGVAIPDTDDADLYLDPVARCFRRIAIDKGKPAGAEDIADRLGLWCEIWAPSIKSNMMFDIVRMAVDESPTFDLDDALGRDLRVTYAERQACRLTTIGSYDVDRRSRAQLAKDRRRERDRLAKIEKRRADGVVPRAEYEATSLSKAQPWLEMGISRRTYERRRAAGRLTSLSSDDSQHVASPSPHPSSIRKPTHLRHAIAEVIPLPTTGSGVTPKPTCVGSKPSKIPRWADGAEGDVGNPNRHREFRTRFPTASRLTKPMMAYATECGFTRSMIDLIYEGYREHNIAQRIYAADWNDAWCGWVNREVTILNARHDRQRRQANY